MPKVRGRKEQAVAGQEHINFFVACYVFPAHVESHSGNNRSGKTDSKEMQFRMLAKGALPRTTYVMLAGVAHLKPAVPTAVRIDGVDGYLSASSLPNPGGSLTKQFPFCFSEARMFVSIPDTLDRKPPNHTLQCAAALYCTPFLRAGFASVVG